MDWRKIRNEYVRTDASYRALSAKYNVPMKCLARKARDERWVDLRKQAREKEATKTVEKIAEQRSNTRSAINEAALQLLQAFQGSIAAYQGDAIPPSAIKDYGSALRSIQTVLESCPSELDIEEQKARIAKLQHEAERDQLQNAPIEVSLEGVEHYAV